MTKTEKPYPQTKRNLGPVYINTASTEERKQGQEEETGWGDPEWGRQRVGKGEGGKRRQREEGRPEGEQKL